MSRQKEGVRYRRDTIEFLHEKFVAESMVECSMRTFSRYIPATSLCKVSLNPELKVEALKEPGVNLEWFLSLDDVQLKNWGD